jgi:hypothetical protein
MKFLLLVLLLIAVSSADILSDLSIISELLQPDPTNLAGTKTTSKGFEIPTGLPTSPPKKIPHVKVKCHGRFCPLTKAKKIALGVTIPVVCLLLLFFACCCPPPYAWKDNLAEQDIRMTGGENGNARPDRERPNRERPDRERPDLERPRYGVYVRDGAQAT